jgi:hypothetical protein
VKKTYTERLTIAWKTLDPELRRAKGKKICKLLADSFQSQCDEMGRDFFNKFEVDGFVPKDEFDKHMATLRFMGDRWEELAYEMLYKHLALPKVRSVNGKRGGDISAKTRDKTDEHDRIYSRYKYYRESDYSRSEAVTMLAENHGLTKTQIRGIIREYKKNEN